jgi:predicted peptidase
METGFLNRMVTVEDDAYRYQVFVPAAYTPSTSWPVILFLHGSGERGSDGLLQTEIGLGSAIRRHLDRYPAIVVFPQAPLLGNWHDRASRIALGALDQTIAAFSTDPNRVYLTGISMGGNGTWYLAYRHPQRFAAVVTICGWVSETEHRRGALPARTAQPFLELARQIRDLPTWVFHGEADTAVPVEESRLVVDALRAVGAQVLYTELPGVGHNSWDAAYRSPDLPVWLLSQRGK